MFNVTRPSKAPASLVKNKSYREADVTQALREMFYGKCYICETKAPISFNIEHFEAHKGDPVKKFDWNNLYYCCSRCNNIKGANNNNMIDCACPDTDVFRAIRHKAPSSPRPRTIVIEAIEKDKASQQTAKLINSIFNDDHTGNKEVAIVDLKYKVYECWAEFLSYVNIYCAVGTKTKQADKDEAFEILKEFMKKEQEYSAFIRWAVLDDTLLCPLLEKYMD